MTTASGFYIEVGHCFQKFSLTFNDIFEAFNVPINGLVNDQAPFNECTEWGRKWLETGVVVLRPHRGGRRQAGHQGGHQPSRPPYRVRKHVNKRMLLNLERTRTTMTTALGFYIEVGHCFQKFSLTFNDIFEAFNVPINGLVNDQAPFNECTEWGQKWLETAVVVLGHHWGGRRQAGHQDSHQPSRPPYSVRKHVNKKMLPNPERSRTTMTTTSGSYIEVGHCFQKFGLTFNDISEAFNVPIDGLVNDQAPFNECSHNVPLFECDQEQQWPSTFRAFIHLHIHCFTVWKWGNPQCFHLPPGFWPMGGLGIAPIPHLTITSPSVNRLCSSRWNYRRCQSPHKGCCLAPASKLIIREKPRLSPK